MGLSINKYNNYQCSYCSVKNNVTKNDEIKQIQNTDDNKSEKTNIDKYVPDNYDTNVCTYSNLNCLKKAYISYNGKRTSFYDLLQEANDKGIIDLKEGNTIGYYTEKAFNELVCKDSLYALLMGNKLEDSENAPHLLNKLLSESGNDLLSLMFSKNK